MFDGTFDNDPNMKVSAYVSEYAYIYMSLVSSCSSIVYQFPRLGMTIGYYKRIKILNDEIDQLENENGNESDEAERQLLLKVNNCDIPCPWNNLELLINNLSLNFTKSRVFLKGSSGSGKSTIVRFLTGVLENKVSCLNMKHKSENDDDEDFGQATASFKKCLVFPQNYTQLILPNATLLQQLSYPYVQPDLKTAGRTGSELLLGDHLPENITFQKISEIFNFFKLNLPENVNSENWTEFSINNWLNSYSNGELQRIIFARVLLLKPEYLVIDETMSNLDKEWIFKIYELLGEKNIKYLTISHDIGIEKFHDEVVDLDLHKKEK